MYVVSWYFQDHYIYRDLFQKMLQNVVGNFTYKLVSVYNPSQYKVSASSELNLYWEGLYTKTSLQVKFPPKCWSIYVDKSL